MRHTVIDPVGVLVEDADVESLEPSQVEEIRTLAAEHGVVVFRAQTLDDVRFADFLRSLGEIVFTEGETPVDGHPDLNVISNVGRTTTPRSTFHVDTSYVAKPPSYTALRAVTVPREGGQTVFSNQYRAWETLPVDMRSDLADRTLTHVVTGLDLPDDAESSAEHPLAALHPLSGRRSLYMSTPKRCASISGMTAEQTARTVQFLYDHSTAERNVYRHTWQPGDVVLWDNRCVMHRADHSGVVGDRVMHRGMAR
ncbi:TauD/TfdA dioxygenase family protein [Rhodococcus sp. MEB064]|uniref:TauD/TfdA dioxygenase family protein n=1 Tax=Rhodococcus sp. MEB064 TaxID=1587522 RepID=UPI0005AC540B|nr:TauD/TfdA family dioxygenase [Rhodococcus sp. MEB064]KIQ19902.1 dioxygenase [Rhodococcus sp. MEB064]